MYKAGVPSFAPRQLCLRAAQAVQGRFAPPPRMLSKSNSGSAGGGGHLMVGLHCLGTAMRSDRIPITHILPVTSMAMSHFPCLYVRLAT